MRSQTERAPVMSSREALVLLFLAAMGIWLVIWLHEVLMTIAIFEAGLKEALPGVVLHGPDPYADGDIIAAMVVLAAITVVLSLRIGRALWLWARPPRRESPASAAPS